MPKVSEIKLQIKTAWWWPIFRWSLITWFRITGVSITEQRLDWWCRMAAKASKVKVVDA